MQYHPKKHSIRGQLRPSTFGRLRTHSFPIQAAAPATDKPLEVANTSTAPCPDLTREEELVKSYLQRAVDGSLPSIHGLRLVQRFARETPEIFSSAALALLQSNEYSPELRFVIVKLLQQPDLMQRLTNPERMEKYSSIRLFKLLKQHDRGLDVRLAQCLPSRYETANAELTLPACDRALDVLDQASEGRRIVPILGHLVDHPAPSLSAKATLVIGKRVKSVAWTKRLLISGDRNSRDRANAIEALWGMNTREALHLFWEHARDHNNRVAGNAVMGLHIMGEATAKPNVERMAQRTEPAFRWTAAWLMEKMQREEHIEQLKRMIKDADPGVRRSALRALVTFHQQQLRTQAEADRIRVMQAATEAHRKEIEEEAIEAAKSQPGELKDSTALLVAPDFNLRLDGRSFTFRKG